MVMKHEASTSNQVAQFLHNFPEFPPNNFTIFGVTAPHPLAQDHLPGTSRAFAQFPSWPQRVNRTVFFSWQKRMVFCSPRKSWWFHGDFMVISWWFHGIYRRAERRVGGTSRYFMVPQKKCPAPCPCWWLGSLGQHWRCQKTSCNLPPCRELLPHLWWQRIEARLHSPLLKPRG